MFASPAASHARAPGPHAAGLPSPSWTSVPLPGTTHAAVHASAAARSARATRLLGGTLAWRARRVALAGSGQLRIIRGNVSLPAPMAQPSPIKPSRQPSRQPAAGAGLAGVAADAAVHGAGRPADDPRAERDRQLAAWLTASAGGDAGAFEAFYGATFAYARTVARRLVRDNAEVEDLLADCYFEAWRNATRFDASRGSPVTWLLTLVRSRGLDALRAAAARPMAAAAAAAGGLGANDGQADTTLAPSQHHVEPPAPDTDDPAEALWRRQSGTLLHTALATLNAAERWVLGLAYLRELSHGDIARCTGMPLGTVKSHALRAQAKLREQFVASGAVPRTSS